MPEVFGVLNPSETNHRDNIDIHQKVKALRKSIQDVNELIKTEKAKRNAEKVILELQSQKSHMSKVL